MGCCPGQEERCTGSGSDRHWGPQGRAAPTARAASGAGPSAALRPRTSAQCCPWQHDGDTGQARPAAGRVHIQLATIRWWSLGRAPEAVPHGRRKHFCGTWPQLGRAGPARATVKTRGSTPHATAAAWPAGASWARNPQHLRAQLRDAAAAAVTDKPLLAPAL